MEARSRDELGLVMPYKDKIIVFDRFKNQINTQLYVDKLLDVLRILLDDVYAHVRFDHINIHLPKMEIDMLAEAKVQNDFQHLHPDLKINLTLV